MAIDFLGREIKEPKKKSEYDVRMHEPEKERLKREAAKKEKKSEPVKSAPALPTFELGEVNLMTAWQRYILKRRLTFTILSVIILAIIGSLSYYFLTRPAPPPVVVINTNTNINQPPPVNINLNLPPVITNENTNVNLPPEPVCGNGKIEANEQCDLTGCGQNYECVDCQCQEKMPPGPLPDTELAPLRGALVKFSGENVIYLIEYNGELRYVDQASVIFKHGENISQIGLDRIYTINDSFKDIRRGKDVFGWIDWDPRVLSQAELFPYQ